jgi:hypothetical protein
VSQPVVVGSMVLFKALQRVISTYRKQGTMLMTASLSEQNLGNVLQLSVASGVRMALSSD